jgi:hypothetical protein
VLPGHQLTGPSEEEEEKNPITKARLSKVIHSVEYLKNQ